MTLEPLVAGIGVVDGEGVAGSAGVAESWRTLGVSPPGDARTFRKVFRRTCDTFRRLDHVSRALVLAGEAAGIDQVVPEAWRGEAALVLETTVGCLDTDLRFAASLGTGMPDGPSFPYTLPSTCLGELALRHGLRGPGICLATGAQARGAALREAVLLLDHHEATCVVTASVDVLLAAPPSLEPVCRAVVVVLAPAECGLAAVAPWAGCGADAYAMLVSRLPRRPAPSATAST